jgi:hypothetical protein
LKDLFISVPILWHFDPKLLMIVETDVSDFTIRAMLLQIKNGLLQSITFQLPKIDKAELKYEIHDEEILVIRSAFKE